MLKVLAYLILAAVIIAGSITLALFLGRPAPIHFPGDRRRNYPLVVTEEPLLKCATAASHHGLFASQSLKVQA